MNACCARDAPTHAFSGAHAQALRTHVLPMPMLPALHACSAQGMWRCAPASWTPPRAWASSPRRRWPSASRAGRQRWVWPQVGVDAAHLGWGWVVILGQLPVLGHACVYGVVFWLEGCVTVMRALCAGWPPLQLTGCHLRPHHDAPHWGAVAAVDGGCNAQSLNTSSLMPPLCILRASRYYPPS